MNSLSELKRLNKERTQGPWEYDQYTQGEGVVWGICPLNNAHTEGIVGFQHAHDYDASFIALSANLMDKLLAVVEAAQKYHLGRVHKDDEIIIALAALTSEAGG